MVMTLPPGAVMGPPTPPLALSAAYLSLLQTRQGLRHVPSAPPASGTDPPAPPEAPPGSGRGRLIDILA